MTEKTTHDRIVERVLAGLSKEGLKRHRRDEYRQGNPKATEAELDLMMAADEKSGNAMGSLAQAKKVMGNSE